MEWEWNNCLRVVCGGLDACSRNLEHWGEIVPRFPLYKLCIRSAASFPYDCMKHAESVDHDMIFGYLFDGRS